MIYRTVKPAGCDHWLIEWQGRVFNGWICTGAGASEEPVKYLSQEAAERRITGLIARPQDNTYGKWRG